MKKRVWKALLCCVLAMAMLPAAAFAAPEADITITDCGAWGEAHPGWFSVGWKYSDGFETDGITAIRVGMKDKWGRSIVEYTADAEQIAYQKDNGYLVGGNLSSAPFYKENNGTPLPDGRDLDWTVNKGEAFEKWQPATFYVEVKTVDKTYYKEASYDGGYPCDHAFTKAVPAKAATCTEDGNIAYWQCKASDCGKIFADKELTKEITLEETVIKAAHKAQKVEAKAPTATEEGNIEYWYCEACGKCFADEALTKEIAKKDTIVAATGETAQPTQTPAAANEASPETGDSTNMLPWVGLMLVAALGGAVVLMVAQKKKAQR